MKYARVKPLFKKNSPLEVGNYRPVSILSIVSKILERSALREHNSSKTNSSVTGCKTSFLL
jgi:hypothetical protein